MCSIDELDELARRPDSIPISCSLKLNLDGLLVKIWDMMALVRVYTKKVGAKPDFDQPVVLTSDRGGTTIKAFCNQIHKTLLKEFQYALVWGTSSKHMPQRVGLQHYLEDEDVVQVGLRLGTRFPGRHRRWLACCCCCFVAAVLAWKPSAVSAQPSCPWFDLDEGPSMALDDLYGF